jgi:hypothetical protein
MSKIRIRTQAQTSGSESDKKKKGPIQTRAVSALQYCVQYTEKRSPDVYLIDLNFYFLWQNAKGWFFDVFRNFPDGPPPPPIDI